MSAEDTAREIAADGISETTMAGRTTKFLTPKELLDAQDRLDRRAVMKRGGLPMAFIPLRMGGTQD